MFANRALMACCVALAGCATTRADKLKPMTPAEQTTSEPAKEKAPVKLAVISLSGLEVDDVMPEIKKLLPSDTRVARFPLFNAILLWGTEEEVALIREAVRPL